MDTLALTNDMLLESGSVRLVRSKTYAPQEPWLQAGTVKENILFGAEYDQKWYGQVINACGLLPDLAQLDHGDNTSVGQEYGLLHFFLFFKSKIDFTPKKFLRQKMLRQKHFFSTKKFDPKIFSVQKILRKNFFLQQIL